MKNDPISVSLDKLVNNINKLALHYKAREDGVFTVDMLKSKMFVFLMQQDENIAHEFSKYVSESINRENKIMEEK